MTAGSDPELKPTPDRTTPRDLDTPVRIADQNSDSPSEATQRRRDVVNSLFQDQSKTNQQTIKPVAGEQPAESKAEAEPRRLREAFPMLLPMNDDGELLVVPENSAIDGPVPPPLPESALLKEAASNTRRAPGQSVPAQALMAGVLLTMVRPGAFRRAVRRITGWKNLVV
jgi:hypothetical protein